MATQSPVGEAETANLDRQALHDALDALLDAEAAREARIDELITRLDTARAEMAALNDRADRTLRESGQLLAESDRPAPPRSGDFDL